MSDRMDNAENLTLLLFATEGKLDALKLRIERKGADANFTMPNGDGLLQAAIRRGHLEMVKYLIEEHNVPIRSVTRIKGEDASAVYLAALCGHLHIVEYLVDTKGEDIIHETWSSYTIVFAAALSGNIELLQYFVGKKCSVQCTDNEGATPLHFAAGSPADRVDVVAYLIDECGCDPLHPDNDGNTSLHMACLKGCINIVKYLVEVKNCDPLRAYAHDRSPLHVACSHNHIHVVKYIVEERKMDVRKAESILIIGHPCCIAAHEGCLEIVKYFIEKGHFELTDVNDCGFSIAYMAMLGDKIEILKYLIEERGFDPMTADQTGCTLLQHAERGDQVAGKCSAYLLNTYSKDADGNVLHKRTAEEVKQDPQGQ